MSRIEFIRTDTEDDTIASFELALAFLISAQCDERYWKWFVIACHAGVQGAFALVLEHGDGLLVQKRGVMRRTLEAVSAGTAPPAPHMDNFVRLYQRVQCRQNLRSPAVQPVASTPELDAAMSTLDTLRNEFLHFNVKRWSIQIELIQSAARSCISVAAFLLRQSPAVLWHEPALERHVISVLANLEEQLVHGQRSV